MNASLSKKKSENKNINFHEQSDVDLNVAARKSDPPTSKAKGASASAISVHTSAMGKKGISIPRTGAPGTNGSASSTVNSVYTSAMTPRTGDV